MKLSSLQNGKNQRNKAQLVLIKADSCFEISGRFFFWCETDPTERLKKKIPSEISKHLSTLISTNCALLRYVFPCLSLLAQRFLLYIFHQNRVRKYSSCFTSHYFKIRNICTDCSKSARFKSFLSRSPVNSGSNLQ